MIWGNCFWIVGGDETRAWSSAAATWVVAANPAYVAWLAAGNAPRRVASIDELRAIFASEYPAGMLETYAAAKRYAVETGGITVNGMAVATDDRSKQMLMGARIAADADASFTTSWVGADGAVVPLTAAQIIALSNAVLAHVNACFATFASVKAGINAGTFTTISAIDAAFAAIS